MLVSILTSIVAFIGTNIDDIFLLTLFFAEAGTKRGARAVVLGQYLGVSTLVAVSLLGALGLSFLPERYIGLLGLVPIVLGVKAWLDRRKEDGEEGRTARGGKIFGVMLVTIANGADNVGVYIPLFAGFDAVQTVMAVLVFALMTAFWCFLGKKLSDLPLLRGFLLKYKHILVPLVFIALGVYILVSGFFAA